MIRGSASVYDFAAEPAVLGESGTPGTGTKIGQQLLHCVSQRGFGGDAEGLAEQMRHLALGCDRSRSLRVEKEPICAPSTALAVACQEQPR